MGLFEEIKERCSAKNVWDFSNPELVQLRKDLMQVDRSEIDSLEDARDFINIVKAFREIIAETDKLRGENYSRLIQSLLSVGEDGLYSDKLRFIFELVQNVDDCDFVNPDDCKLAMRFDVNQGNIILEYNEVGFSPLNVFAITGIAEAAKNVGSAKTEIGEKGIGFKSVFGIADKVRIESGYFSFELYKKNFTIPQPVYENFEYVQGTRMTLYADRRNTSSAFFDLLTQYGKEDTLFNKNPLLFLNKLTELKFYFDSFRMLQFTVDRSDVSQTDSFRCEEKVVVGAFLKNGSDPRLASAPLSLTCIRYTRPVFYDEEMCQSRYGENTKVGQGTGKKMLLQAVVPIPEEAEKVGHGTLYSFLPTQVHLNVPLALHAPFKLDASREFVDPQGNNRWFKQTRSSMAEFINMVYADLSKRFPESICTYLPSAKKSVFSKDNEKVKCLYSSRDFQADTLLKKPLFLSMDGRYHTADEVYFISSGETDQPEEASKYIHTKRVLFKTDNDEAAARLRILQVKDLPVRILEAAFKNEQITGEALEFIRNKIRFQKLADVPGIRSIQFTVPQLEQMGKFQTITTLFGDYFKNMDKGKYPEFTIQTENTTPISQLLDADVETKDFPVSIQPYLNKILNRSVLVSDVHTGFYLPAGNMLAVSKEDPISSITAFCNKMETNNLFAANLIIAKASEDLNRLELDENITDEQYFNQLRNVRQSVRKALGENGYHKFLELINQSRSEVNRFYEEILQNADDCQYPEGETPEFSMEVVNSEDYRNRTIITRYNETGFTRKNVRAITAIGESTKKKIQGNPDLETIGEKGVGFKSTFAVASEVVIHSRNIDFSLKSTAPTIPVFLKHEKDTDGTQMEFRLNKSAKMNQWDENYILSICLCLRNLKSLNICGNTVYIQDDPGTRTVYINKKKHVFRRFVHTFQIDDPNLIEAKKQQGQVCNTIQTISIYQNNQRIPNVLYSGLPTEQKIDIPAVIDAPFELTTSREKVLSNTPWNNRIRDEVYIALAEFLESSKEQLKSKVLDFIKFSAPTSAQNTSQRTAIFDANPYLNNYSYYNLLKNRKILPTLEKNYYCSFADKPKVPPVFFREILIGYSDVVYDRKTVLNVSASSYSSVLSAYGIYEISITSIL